MYKSYIYQKNGNVLLSTADVVKVSEKMTAGFYKLSANDTMSSGIEPKLVSFEPQICHTDFKYDHKDKIDYYIDTFSDPNAKELVNSLGYLHKFGLMLYGKAGTGKSTIIMSVADRIARNDGLVFFMRDMHLEYIQAMWDFLVEVRKKQDNPIVVILEEFDSFLEYKQNEGFWKTVLDGHNSIDNCLFLASTNHFSSISDEITSRPSRFKYCFEIKGIEDEESIKLIIKEIVKGRKDDADISQMAKHCRGFTLDAIKDYALSSLYNFHTIEKTKIGF